MMTGKISPIFSLFSLQFDEARQNLTSLSKQFKGKKSMELEEKFIFFEIYINLLSRIHFNEERLKFELFSPFKVIFKNLKKVKHLKLITQRIEDIKFSKNIGYNTYEKHLAEDKKKLYAEGFDLVVSFPLQTWENLYQEIHQYSKGLKPLMINTAITQIINEELDYFQLDQKTRLDSKALKDIYEGLRVITALENLRVKSGFNPIFVNDVHDQMKKLQQALFSWYRNHLFLQHLTHFLANKNDVNKKYIELLQTLKTNKKEYTQKVEQQCRSLFERILE
jgi:hypothetical protein